MIRKELLIGRLLIHLKWATHGLWVRTLGEETVHDIFTINYITNGDGKAIQVNLLKASIIMGWI
jgi:hypothetical protein